MTQYKVAYICDQKKDCSRFEHCQKECFRTFDTMHAANGIARGVFELDGPRFKKLGTVNEVTYYEELKPMAFKRID